NSAAEKLVGLADVTPTAWHGCELAEVCKDDVVGVWGCGAIGLSIQRLSKLRGARKVYAVDKDVNRLKIAESFGMIPVNVNEHSDPADYILSIEPHGLDRGIEASGFRSTNSVVHNTMRKLGIEGDSSDTVSAVIKATRKGGNIALIGDFFYSTNNFPIGMMMEKAITVRGGQLYAEKYFPLLLDFVVKGQYDPSFVFTHKDKLENISEAYDKFFNHEVPGGLKVCISTPFGRSQEG
ncbi:hypothetical protein J4E82_008726, partial [Alternaria postmessia]|uniref:uncharacterized protein n=1 Tax=Alternaria postmessia TaxID=1187938 RepID=UPI0022250D38